LKLFIILILLAAFAGLLYFRLRPYIQMARRMLGVVRGVRSVSRNEPAQPLRSESSSSSKLVRCDSCNTWIPASRAVKLRSSLATYCSHACLEASAAESSKRRTAG
jgi:hypothetical protein